METITKLATLNLVVSDNGVQKIELVPTNINILSLFGIDKYNIVAGNASSNFQVYFGDLLHNLNLSTFYTYRQNTYFGLRHCSTEETLMFWNSNNRTRYLNVNLKESVLAPIVSQIEYPIDTDNRFSNTKRIRLHSKDQVDSFFELLKPVLAEL